MRLLLVGYGRMGRLVEALALERGWTIAAALNRQSGPCAIVEGDFGPVDIAVDFSEAGAVPHNLPQLAERGISVVLGTTGWEAQEGALRTEVERAGIGVLAAANFSLGANLFQLIVEEAVRRFAPHDSYGAWINELHHAAKKDAPSGTALRLRTAMTDAGFARPIDMSSTRAGSIPGTHTVGFDGPFDTVTLTHAVRDRAVFARGALAAAAWLRGRTGWFTMRDMLTDS